MRKIVTLASLAVLLAVPATARAGQSDFGQAVDMIVTEHNAVMFTSTGTRTNPPSCAINQNRWAIDPRTDAGRAMLSILLTAIARGKLVWIHGTGTCSVWPDTESVNHFLVQN